jgi:outer membrane receptor protein involved in Fe transport
LAQCYGPSATAASQAAFCPYIHRTAGTHTIKVNTTVLATSGYVQANNANTGGLATSGFDFESHYNVDLGDWGMRDSGSLAFSFVGTWTKTAKVEPVAGLGEYDCAGLYGQTCGVTPTWRHKLRVTWATPWDVSLSANWRHTNSVTLDTDSSQALLAGTPTPVDHKLDAMDYIDLAATWNVRDNVDITGGINNVFDKDPPLTTKDPSATNTFPGNYDVLGRYMFLQTTVKF